MFRTTQHIGHYSTDVQNYNRMYSSDVQNYSGTMYSTDVQNYRYNFQNYMIDVQNYTSSMCKRMHN